MDPLGGGRKHGATFLGVVTNGNHIIECLPRKLIDRFGTVTGNIDSDLAHDGDGFRAYMAWFCAGAFNLICRPSIVPKQAFRHLASR